MRIIIISAISQNGVIGKANGEMPWHNKEEFQHFKKTTLGFPVIMGRKTFETLGKPLKERENIIVTRKKIKIQVSDEPSNALIKWALGIGYCVPFPLRILCIDAGCVLRRE